MTLQQPILTKSLTSALLLGSGDLAAQATQAGGIPKRFDWDRTKRMMLWGLCFGTLAHGWYLLLDSMVRVPGPAGVVAKIVCDQLIWTPPVNLLFFTTMSWMEGHRLSDAFEHGKAMLWPTLKVNWVVWPIIHIATFGFIPLHQRVLFINLCSFGWSIFLSYMANNGARTQAPMMGKNK